MQMKRGFLARNALTALTALSLAGCATLPSDTGITSNSTVETVQTRAGQTLVVAWRAFDALLTAVDALQAAGAITAGSPRALRIANAIDRTRTALNAATDAVRAGNQQDFTQALALAQAALGEARAAIGGS
jgi:hypothetical protein